MISLNLQPGLEAVVQRKVLDDHTAKHHGSGELACLLATPAYVDQMILAAIEAVEKKLPKGFITVGKHMEFTHEAPTGIGMSVSIKATLQAVDGNRLLFSIIAFDEIGDIGHGKHERVVVNRDQLLKRAEERMKEIKKTYLK
jgi:predicted thioesterase